MVTMPRRTASGWFLVLSLTIGCDKNPLDPTRPGLAGNATPAMTGADARSNTAGASTLSPPDNTAAIAISTSRINVTWRDNSTKETGFELQRSTTGPGGTFTVLTKTGGESVTYSDIGLTLLTQYCYRLRAFRTSGPNTTYSGFSNTACATTLGPPSSPSLADATPLASTVVNVVWRDGSINESGFRVETAATSAGPWSVATTTGPNITAAAISGVQSEHSGCYRIVAFNLYGDSGPSNIDCTAPPAAPTNLTATTVGLEIDLAWVDNSAFEDGYVVLRDMGYGTELVADLPANSTTYRDLKVGSGISYIYYVRAKKDRGFSDESDAATAECTDLACPAACVGNLQCGLGMICGPDQTCVPHCADGVNDGDETDVDCGGNTCGGCDTGQHCNVHADCASDVCSYGVCQDAGGQP